MAALHVGHVHPSFWWRIEHCPTPPKFLVPEKSGTRTHGTRANLLVPVSGTRNLGGELGSCAMGLTCRISIDLTVFPEIVGEVVIFTRAVILYNSAVVWDVIVDREQKDYVSLSFATISAVGSNAAVIHYKSVAGYLLCCFNKFCFSSRSVWLIICIQLGAFMLRFGRRRGLVCAVFKSKDKT